jgi:hypothetical protein
VKILHAQWAENEDSWHSFVAFTKYKYLESASIRELTIELSGPQLRIISSFCSLSLSL